MNIEISILYQWSYFSHLYYKLCLQILLVATCWTIAQYNYIQTQPHHFASWETCKERLFYYYFFNTCSLFFSSKTNTHLGRSHVTVTHEMMSSSRKSISSSCQRCYYNQSQTKNPHSGGLLIVSLFMHQNNTALSFCSVVYLSLSSGSLIFFHITLREALIMKLSLA